MDPELTVAEVEALNKLADDLEKLNKQMQRFEESRRLQAESRANKFDRMIALLEKMMLTPNSESEPELCVPVETDDTPEVVVPEELVVAKEAYKDGFISVVHRPSTLDESFVIDVTAREVTSVCLSLLSVSQTFVTVKETVKLEFGAPTDVLQRRLSMYSSSGVCQNVTETFHSCSIMQCGLNACQCILFDWKYVQLMLAWYMRLFDFSIVLRIGENDQVVHIWELLTWTFQRTTWLGRESCISQIYSHLPHMMIVWNGILRILCWFGKLEELVQWYRAWMIETIEEKDDFVRIGHLNGVELDERIGKVTISISFIPTLGGYAFKDGYLPSPLDWSLTKEMSSLLHSEMLGELNGGYDILYGSEEFLVIWLPKPPRLPPENVLKIDMLDDDVAELEKGEDSLLESLARLDSHMLSAGQIVVHYGNHAETIHVIMKPPRDILLHMVAGETRRIDLIHVGICLPLLVYVSPEKRPSYDLNKKAQAVHASVHLSASIAKAPFILNLDCEHYIYSSQALRDEMCCFMVERRGDVKIYCPAIDKQHVPVDILSKVLRKQNNNKTILVVDLGGSTPDACDFESILMLKVAGYWSLALSSIQKGLAPLIDNSSQVLPTEFYGKCTLDMPPYAVIDEVITLEEYFYRPRTCDIGDRDFLELLLPNEQTVLKRVYKIVEMILHIYYESGSKKVAQWVTKPPPMPPDIIFIYTLLIEGKVIRPIHSKVLAPLVEDMVSVTHHLDHAHFIITNTYQDVAQVDGSHRGVTLTWPYGPYRGIHGIDTFHTVFNIVPPGVDMTIYFSYNDDYKRLTTRHESIEVVVYSSVSYARLDWVKNLKIWMVETTFLNLDFSLDDHVFLVRYINKFFLFSLPRPPEIATLRTRLILRGEECYVLNIIEIKGSISN